MIYFLEVLTSQIPKARMLMPVTGTGKQQLGTTIFSVTDEPFTIENLAHLRIINFIDVH